MNRNSSDWVGMNSYPILSPGYLSCKYVLVEVKYDVNSLVSVSFWKRINKIFWKITLRNLTLNSNTNNSKPWILFLKHASQPETTMENIDDYDSSWNYIWPLTPSFPHETHTLFKNFSIIFTQLKESFQHHKDQPTNIIYITASSWGYFSHS